MSLASVLEPTDQALWQATIQVIERVRAAPDAHEALDAGLDAIVTVLGADRGFLLLALGHGDVVLRARDRAGALDSPEHEEISRSVVRRARDEGAVVCFDAADERAGASLGELGILAALAAPVRAPHGRIVGVLYMDVREPGKSFGPAHEHFVDVAGAILAPQIRDSLTLEASEARLARADVVDHNELPLWDLVATPELEGLAAELRLALRSDLNVLFVGESGTGKTLLARAFAHAARPGPVVRATLGSSDDLNTITSELFGHVRGAFSGAARRRVGLVEHADGGTLVLDEVLNLPLHAQQLLLDLTQFGYYRPLGDDSAAPRRADIRIVAATQGDLEAAMSAGTFRRDLFYRLAGHVLTVPPLRARTRDIPALAETILRRIDPARPWHLSLGARRALARSAHAWPGNVRELEAVVARARTRALLADASAEVIELAHVDPQLASGLEQSASERTREPAREVPAADAADIEARWARIEGSRERLAAEERAVLADALALEGGVVSRVARRLGLPRTTLLHRLQLLDLTSGR